MFSAFRSKTSKTPTPSVEVVSFDGETLEIQSETPLPVGNLTVILLHSELELEKECNLTIEQAFPEKKLYWATLPGDGEVANALHSLIPKEAELAAAGGELPPTWEEKRSRVRLQRILGAMSPSVAGFKCVTHDIHRDGLRLQLDKPLEAGSTIKVRFELEDHRLPPFDVLGLVRWSQENPAKGYWAGITFTQIKDTERDHIDKFIAEAQAHESGVLSRDYIGD